MRSEGEISRSDFLKGLVIGVASMGTAISMGSDHDLQQPPAQPQAIALTKEDLRAFAKVAGLTFTDEEIDRVLRDIQSDRAGYTAVREASNDYGLLPANVYRVPGVDDLGPATVNVKPAQVKLRRPDRDEDVAFLTVNELSHLIRTRQITSTELAKIYLARLKQYGNRLLCVVTLTEDLALGQAARADAEIAAGKYRGSLHGIPYGIKDLFAVKGYPTQWGTEAFRGQVVDEDCAVFEKLTMAGAVCLAKLSLGALAMNDNWFGGRTLNPWNPKEGSSGSSAGSASAMAAGLIAFGIGTETSGSIVSPSLRCRVTGFRPTFGSISRFGAMCLSWSMDKVGPICRTAEDGALVLAALLGRDERDLSSVDRPFVYRSPRDLKGIKIGVLGNAATSEYAKMLESLGAIMGEFKLPRVPAGLDNIISVEAATMFDHITRDGRLNLVKENQWPQIFRAARFIPAVEYAQAERVRMKLFRDYEAAFSPFDLVLAAGSAGPMIYNSNLTGHPQIHVPFKPDDKGGYVSFSLLAKPFEEHKLIGAAHLVQMKTGFYRLRPDLSKL
jgi:Asp-tRNA(Asn)/Glu-tRNA(Gln) amidotransferase A subunit family amidase